MYYIKRDTPEPINPSIGSTIEKGFKYCKKIPKAYPNIAPKVAYQYSDFIFSFINAVMAISKTR